ncbi:uncharacterized protein FYN16_001402 [Cariama cristata]
MVQPDGGSDPDSCSWALLPTSLGMSTFHGFLVQATAVCRPLKLTWLTDKPVWVEQWPMTEEKRAAVVELVQKELQIVSGLPFRSRSRTIKRPCGDISGRYSLKIAVVLYQLVTPWTHAAKFWHRKQDQLRGLCILVIVCMFVHCLLAFFRNLLSRLVQQTIFTYA